MNALLWLQIALYMIFAACAGRLLIRIFRLDEHLLMKTWAASYLAGQLIFLLLTLLTGFAGVPLRVMIWGVLAVTAAGCAYQAFQKRGLRELGIMALAGIVAVPVVGLLFPDLLLLTHWTPVIEHDAYSYWIFHGKVLLYDNGLKPHFFADPANEWSICDYPLLISAQAAWVSFFTGGWHPYASRAFLLVNAAAYVYLFWRIMLARRFPWWLALLAVVVVFDKETYNYVSGYADNHYEMPLILALLALTAGDARSSLPFALLMGAFAVNVKNEPQMYCFVVCAAVLLVSCARWLRTRSFGPAALLLQNRLALAFAGLLGVVPVAMWLVFKKINGIAHPLGLLSRLTDISSVLSLLSERVGKIAFYFLDFYDFHGAQYIIGLLLAMYLVRAMIFRRRGAPEVMARRSEVITWLMFFGLNLLIFAPYTVTPMDLSFHLGTSAGRLLFLPYLLLLVQCIFCVDVLLALREKLAGSSPDVIPAAK